ncbi:DHH family phosphoesterase [Halocatena salina]|uniref:DHHA1 domain-containing protein n=1 Tax=Halocatena salina TaxID=2934340 RepID=A0A8U0A5B8_9EURY|nr:DHH family phosphoesterase [Halocatena salina]UPM43143.1 DHHA1 domain-containing protein [Halocatena salina]
MVTRLVLGCGSLGQLLADTLDERPGELQVIVRNTARAETLRGDGIPAVQTDDFSPEVLRSVCNPPVDSILVASDDTRQNHRTAHTARAAYPQAMLVAYLGASADNEIRSELSSVADRVIDPGAAIAEQVLASAGRQGHRVRQLHRTLRAIDGRLAVVMHDNPDPDAIASALALVDLAERVNCSADACYSGDITHQENRALVNVLDYDLLHFASDEIDLSEYGGIALVDHARPGVNDPLPPGTEVDIVIDHHPPRKPVEARFVDLRSDVGATSTLLVDYFQRLDIVPKTPITTGLLFGIWVDTKQFSREIAVDDFEAAAYLTPFADMGILAQIEEPQMTVETFETIGRAIRNRTVKGSVLTSCVEFFRDRDAIAQASDRLLDIDGVTTTLVYGIRDDTVYASARTRSTPLDVGETLRDAFDQIGDAGGHADMAGAQIPLGFLGVIEDEEAPDDGRDRLIETVRTVIDERFFETIRERPSWQRNTSDVNSVYW